MSGKIYAIGGEGQISPQGPPPDPDVVELLRKLLALAEAGTLQAIFAVGWNSDNTVASGWQGSHKAAFTLLGGIEECKHEYIRKEFERRP